MSAANSAIWAAEDGGYLKKYGLNAEVRTIAYSTQAVPAMLSGEVPLNCGLSGTAVVASDLLPNGFHDDSFLKKLDDGGFIKSILGS